MLDAGAAKCVASSKAPALLRSGSIAMYRLGRSELLELPNLDVRILMALWPWEGFLAP
jgi:hypothetical protein